MWPESPPPGYFDPPTPELVAEQIARAPKVTDLDAEIKRRLPLATVAERESIRAKVKRIWAGDPKVTEHYEMREPDGDWLDTVPTLPEARDYWLQRYRDHNERLAVVKVTTSVTYTPCRIDLVEGEA